MKNTNKQAGPEAGSNEYIILSEGRGDYVTGIVWQAELHLKAAHKRLLMSRTDLEHQCAIALIEHWRLVLRQYECAGVTQIRQPGFWRRVWRWIGGAR